MTSSKGFYRIMLGAKSVHADKCHKNNYIGTDFNVDMDLTGKLVEDRREFNKWLAPYYHEKNAGKSKVVAGLACGAIHTISKGIRNGDIVLCPDGNGSYYVGKIAENYSYHPERALSHCRAVKWYDLTIPREDMSQPLKNSTGSIGTVSMVTKHAEEIERLIEGIAPTSLIASDEEVVNPIEFAMEKYLEEFLVDNWAQTFLGQEYDVFEEDGELIGQQFQTDTGRMDILAISKDKKTLLVVELKKGRASDAVVGQVQRYMGFVLEELAEPEQNVRGIIIALEDNLSIRRALKVAPLIDFYRYQIDFKLFKSEK